MCGICSGGSGIARCPLWIEMHNCWLCKGHLCWRNARDFVPTTDGRVDATVDRAACLGTLVVLQSVVEVLFHGCSNGVDNGLGG